MRNPLLSDLCREHRAKPVPPKTDGLTADVDPALGQEILDVAQRQWVPHIHHYDQTDHFWRAVEISEWAAHGPERHGQRRPEELPSHHRAREGQLPIDTPLQQASEVLVNPSDPGYERRRFEGGIPMGRYRTRKSPKWPPSYYAQGDALLEMASKHRFHWSVARPYTII